jgi:hypothetical protein
LPVDDGWFGALWGVRPRTEVETEVERPIECATSETATIDT